jgi:hypothetical protein
MMAEKASPEAPDYPRWWDFDEDGAADGSFLRMGRGYTANGEKPFVVLRIDDTERTVWLLHDVLRNQFAREVHRRPDKTIHVGEQVRVWKLEPRESKSNVGRSYTDYRVEFPDGPESTQADLIGPPPETEQQTEAESVAGKGGGPGDEIPFQ